MPLTDEQRDIIMQDLIDIFKVRYGDDWRTKLTTNLKPSPLAQIAEQRGVKITDVRKVRSQLLLGGRLLQWYTTLLEPVPLNDSLSSL
jgi:hypothetical protein